MLIGEKSTIENLSEKDISYLTYRFNESFDTILNHGDKGSEVNKMVLMVDAILSQYKKKLLEANDI